MKQSDIVILHGWNLSAKRFAPLVQQLRARGYRLHSPDLPGFGKEAPPVAPWHARDYAYFLHEYLEKRKIKKPVLIGHSFGGRVALTYAQMYPENLRALVLSGTPGFSPVPKGKLLFFLVAAKVGRIIFSIPPLTLFADWAKRLLYYASGTKDFLRAEGVMRETFKNIVEDQLTDAMETLSVPCLLVWGEFDILVPVAIARQMQEVIPQANIKVIPQADHGVPFKEPKVFASYVERFLESL